MHANLQLLMNFFLYETIKSETITWVSVSLLNENCWNLGNWRRAFSFFYHTCGALHLSPKRNSSLLEMKYFFPFSSSLILCFKSSFSSYSLLSDYLFWFLSLKVVSPLYHLNYPIHLAANGSSRKFFQFPYRKSRRLMLLNFGFFPLESFPSGFCHVSTGDVLSNIGLTDVTFLFFFCSFVP